MKIIKAGYESVIRDQTLFLLFPKIMNIKPVLSFDLAKSIDMSRASVINIRIHTFPFQIKTRAKTLLIDSSVAFKYSAGHYNNPFL